MANWYQQQPFINTSVTRPLTNLLWLNMHVGDQLEEQLALLLELLYFYGGMPVATITPAQQVLVTVMSSQVQGPPQDYIDTCNDFAMDMDLTILQPPSVTGPSKLINDVAPHPNTCSPLAPHATTPLSIPSSPYTMHPPSPMLLSEDQPISMPLEQPQMSRSQPRRHREKVSTKPAAILDAKTGFVAACDVMGPTSTLHEETESHWDLGFYDDPNDFDDLHNDLLAHTSPTASEDENEVPGTTPPFTLVHTHRV
ncbi:hypothetical protein EDB19DRAFT_1827652 [Suillus lakei]|nr:hypothetical protein EDB19DRAFT_1827652 [Suillus lakei]